MILLSDTQIADWQEFSEQPGQRLEETLYPLKQALRESCKGKQPIIHLGDWFEQLNPPTAIMAETADLIKEMHNLGSGRIYSVIGNHDINVLGQMLYTKTELLPILTLGDIAVEVEPGTYVLTINYSSSPEYIKSKYKEKCDEARDYKDRYPKCRVYLLGHFGVAGARLTPYLTNIGEVDQSLFADNPFDYVLLGHYHSPQRIRDNVYYLGAPVWHTIEDAHDKKRGIWSIEEGRLRFNPLDTPRFIRLDWEPGEALPDLSQKHRYHIHYPVAAADHRFIKEVAPKFHVKLILTPKRDLSRGGKAVSFSDNPGKLFQKWLEASANPNKVGLSKLFGKVTKDLEGKLGLEYRDFDLGYLRTRFLGQEQRITFQPRTMLLGPNGAGKSTLVKMLLLTLSGQYYGKKKDLPDDYIAEMEINEKHLVAVDGKGLSIEGFANRTPFELQEQLKLLTGVDNSWIKLFVINRESLPLEICNETALKDYFVELFGIGWIDTMREHCGKIARGAHADTLAAESSHSLVKVKLDGFKRDTERRELELTELTKEKNRLETEIEKLKKQTKAVNEPAETNLKQLKADRDSTQEGIGDASSNRDLYYRKLNELDLKEDALKLEVETISGYLAKGLCPTCQQKYPAKKGNDRIAAIGSEMAEIESSRRLWKKRASGAEVDVKRLENGLSSFNKRIADLEEVLQKRKLLQHGNIQNLEGQLVSVNEHIQKLTKVKKPKEEVELEKQVDKLDRSIKQSKSISGWYSALEGHLQKHNFPKWILRDYLGTVNDHINNHLQALDNRFRINFSYNDKEDKIIRDLYRGRVLSSTGSLSAGEAKLVRVAMILGCLEFASHFRPIPLVVWDDVFDSLSLSRREEVAKAIIRFKVPKVTIVCSHDAELSNCGAEIIKVERSGSDVKTSQNWRSATKKGRIPKRHKLGFSSK